MTETHDSNRNGWRSQVALTVPEAAEVLGISRNLAYSSAKRGELPTINFGAKILVPVAKLREVLGEQVES